MACSARGAARALRPGPGARGGDDRALPQRARRRARARERPARRGRPRRLRRLDAPAPRLRDAAAARRAPFRDRVCGGRVPGVDVARRGDPGGRAAVSRRLGRRRPSSGCLRRRLGPTSATGRWPPPTERLLQEAEVAAGREEQIEAARRIFRAGFIGEALVRHAQETEAMDASGDPHRGLLSGADLAGWEATWEQPLAVDYEDLTVLKPGPWSQGPVFLQQLRLLEGFDLAALGTAEYVHARVECAKLAFADREAWYGDPAFVDVPTETLLSRAYADDRRRLVGDQASGELRARVTGRSHAEAREPRHGVRGASRARRSDAPAERHLPPRRRRPLRQPRLRDPQRRLAYRLTRRPGARLLSGHPGSDVLARGGSCGLAGTRQAAADDALADARPARRRPLSRPRHAGRRPAGPVVAQRPPRSCPLRPRPAGCDRRAPVPHGGVSVVLLSAQHARPPRCDRGAVSTSPRSCGSEATRWKCTARGRWAGSARRAGKPDGTLKAAADSRADGYAAGR